MSKNKTFVILPCDCNCCMFVIERIKWEDEEVAYNISVQDSKYTHNYNTIWGRIKRACKILFGKAIYYNDVYINDEEVFKKFLSELNELIDN